MGILRYALFFILLLSSANAATWYARTPCTYNGTGATSDCAASAGAAGAWNSHPNVAWDSVSAGDTLYYIGTFDDAEAAPALWMTVEKNGTSDAWIKVRGDHAAGAGIIQCRSGVGIYGIQWGPPKNGSYIEWIGLEIKDMSISAVPQETDGTAHDFKFTNCKFVNSGYTPYGTTYNVTFTGCEFNGSNFSSQNAIYMYDNITGTSAGNFVFEDCYFHDYGSPEAAADGHAIGWQSRSGLTVRNSRFVNCGSGIVCWFGAVNESKNINIINNYFQGMNASYCYATPGYAIVLQSDNTYTSGDAGNNLISGNIIVDSVGTGVNEGAGIFSSRKESTTYIRGNTVRNCTISYKFSQPNADGHQGELTGNTSISPRNYHVYFAQGGGAGKSWVEDSNRFYPVSGTDFYYTRASGTGTGAVSLTNYKAAHLTDDTRTVETNGVTLESAPSTGIIGKGAAWGNPTGTITLGGSGTVTITP